MNKFYLDNNTVEDIIRQSLTFKNKQAGRSWCEKTLKEKAAREVELQEQAKQAEKRAKFRQFLDRESKPARLDRTDAQKRRSAINYAKKHDLNLDELIDAQRKLYEQDIKRTEELIDNALETEETLTFGFELER